MGLRGIDACQRPGALELIAQVAMEVGYAARVQVHHGDISIVGPARKAAAQHEGWEEMQRQAIIPQSREIEKVTHILGANLC